MTDANKPAARPTVTRQIQSVSVNGDGVNATSAELLITFQQKGSSTHQTLRLGASAAVGHFAATCSIALLAFELKRDVVISISPVANGTPLITSIQIS